MCPRLKRQRERFVVVLAAKQMDSAIRCRYQLDECLRLIQSAQSETEARIRRDLAQSLVTCRKSNRTIRQLHARSQDPS
jgi:hypothetical protein